MSDEIHLTRWQASAEVVLFAALLVTPLLLLSMGIDGREATEELEKRRLAEFPDPPSLTQAPEFLPELERWFEDSLPYRTPLAIRLNLCLLQCGHSGHEDVMIGREGWLFLSSHLVLADSRRERPFSKDQLVRIGEAMKARYEWLARRGIDYALVIAPNKHTIYPEYLPTWAKRESGGVARADQIVDHLREHTTIKVVDLRAPLLDAKTQYRLYHLRDTHWNPRGAEVAARAIVAALESAGLDAEAFEHNLGLLRWTERTTEGGDLAWMLGLQGRLQEITPEHTRPGIRQVEYPLPPEFSSRIQDKSVDTRFKRKGPNVFFFRDSFGNALLPLLPCSTARMISVSRPMEERPVTTNEILRWVAEKEKPDLVIEEVVERFLGRTLPDDASIWEE